MASSLTDRDPLRRAREVLTRHYPEQNRIRMLMFDVGLTTERVDMSGPAVLVWFNVLEEAQRHGRVEALIARAAEDYPASTELRDLARLIRGSAVSPEAPANDVAPRMFLSFAEADGVIAATLRDRLGVMGFDPIVAAESRTVGEELRAGVLRAVEGSDAAMVLVSAASRSAAHLAPELRLVLDRRLRSSGYLVVPVRLDDAELPRELSHVAALDLRGFTDGVLPEATVKALSVLRERLVLGRVAPQVVEEADRAGDPLLSFLRRLAAS